jgi:hypothetical protein
MTHSANTNAGSQRIVGSDVATVLLTRFNVRLSAHANPKILSLEWLRHRLQLFKEVTLASVSAQTAAPDQWFVFFDAETPNTFRKEVDDACKDLGFITPVYCVEFTADTYQNAIRKWLPNGTTWLVTTRIDSDDGLHPASLSNVYSTIQVGRREFINPSRGLIICGRKAYRKRDYSSPFISLSEPAERCDTVWMEQHQRLARCGPIRQLVDRDSWVQVVHGGNIANQIRGVRAPFASIDKTALPALLASQLRDDGFVELATDNTLGLVSRYARSLVRRVKREYADRQSR